jgi:hypothetical protein
MGSEASKLIAPLQDGNHIAVPSFCALMKFFFLEYAGELRIIALRKKSKG